MAEPDSAHSWCRRWESNPYESHPPLDFESSASASSATPARMRRKESGRMPCPTGQRQAICVEFSRSACGTVALGMFPLLLVDLLGESVIVVFDRQRFDK